MDKKQQVINEYLLGDLSYRQLAEVHNIGSSTIHRWVACFQGRSYKIAKDYKILTLPVMKQPKIKEVFPDEVAALKKELAQERLRSKLLTAMIDIAEEQFKIPIRKKSGTKPLKK
jgi:transposase-like protein